MDSHVCNTALNDIRTFDPRASLSVVSLDSVWNDVSKTAVEVAKAPQPTAGTSTDMRLFRLRPLQDEAAVNDRTKLPSSSVLTRDGKFGPEDIPLFYDETYLLDIEGVQQRPYFFRLTDLKKSYQASLGKQLVDPPSMKASTLGGLIQSMKNGDARAMQPSALLVAASEAAAIVERMNAGSTSSLESDSAGSQGAAAAPTAGGRGMPTAAGARPMDGNTFFLNVPYGGGRTI